MRVNKLSHAIIAVIAGMTASSAFSQTDTSESPEEIVVQGFRASLAKAADQKRTADSIQDSIVAEDLGKMPDQNVAESLQRITGVSISRTNGEGSKITIRGFGPQFNVVKLNDRTLATTGTARDFDFQVLPSELISGADVIKSPTAKLSAGSIGGYVNLHTARPLDNPGFHASGSVNAKYQDLEEKVNPELSGVISDSFADDTIGVLLGLSYKDTDSRIDQYRTNNWGEYSAYNRTGSFAGYGFPLPKAQVLDEEGKPTTLEGSRGPGRVIFETSSESRERIGANASIQWKPSDVFTSTLDLLYTKLDRELTGSGVQVPTQTNTYTAASVTNTGTLRTATLSNVDLEMILDYSLEKSTTKAVGYNFEFKQDLLTVKGDISYSKAEADIEGDNSTALHYTRFNADGTLHPSTINLDFTHGDIPSMSATGLDLTDPSAVRAAWQRYAGNKAEDEVKEAKLDVKYDIDAGVVKSLESGIAYSNRNLTNTAYGTEFDRVSGAATWSGTGMYIGDGANYGGASTVGQIDTSIFKLTSGNYMKGTSGNFPREWLTVTSHKAYREAGQAYLESVPDRANTDIVKAGWDTLYPSAAAVAAEETSKSAYVQANLGGDLGDKTWTGNVGVRYVKTDTDSTGLISTIDLLKVEQLNPLKNTADTSSKVATIANSDDYFLPSANFSLNLNDGNYVRLGLAKTITRPGLADSAANFSESPGFAQPTVGITGGNPDLKPYQVKQLDLSFEHYGEEGSAYSVGYFYKDISSFISQIVTTGAWDGPVDPALTAAYAAQGINDITYTSNRMGNRKGGTVQGLELGALHTFDNLPGIWSGLGIQANYTYAKSKDKDALPIIFPSVVEPGNGLEGFAKNSYNVTGFYDKDGLEIRLAYNYRGEFMNSRAGDGTSPEYTDAYGQIDFSASYDITDNVTASLEAANLGNEKRVQYLGQRDRVDYVELSGVRYQIGLRAKF